MARALYPETFNVVTAAYDGSIAVEIGDLMYLDTDDAKPASSLADGGTEPTNQQTLAAAFLGVAVERKLATDAAGDIDVAVDWTGVMSCASDTYEVGDMVAPDENAGGTGLEDQKVVKTTDALSAIGYVIRREPAAVTSVHVRLISRKVGYYVR